LVDRQFREQRDFAKAIGVSATIVSNWRCGRSGTYTKYLPVIASVLGTPVEYLLTGEEQKSAPPVPTDEESVANLIDQLTPQQLTELIARASEKLRQLM
jgi:transcriptional regulator with XRE-family HTH domain